MSLNYNSCHDLQVGADEISDHQEPKFQSLQLDASSHLNKKHAMDDTSKEKAGCRPRSTTYCSPREINTDVNHVINKPNVSKSSSSRQYKFLPRQKIPHLQPTDPVSVQKEV